MASTYAQVRVVQEGIHHLGGDFTHTGGGWGRSVVIGQCHVRGWHQRLVELRNELVVHRLSGLDAGHAAMPPRGRAARIISSAAAVNKSAV